MVDLRPLDSIPLEEFNPELETTRTGPVLLAIRISGFFSYHPVE